MACETPKSADGIEAQSGEHVKEDLFKAPQQDQCMQDLVGYLDRAYSVERDTLIMHVLSFSLLEEHGEKLQLCSAQKNIHAADYKDIIDIPFECNQTLCPVYVIQDVVMFKFCHKGLTPELQRYLDDLQLLPAAQDASLSAQANPLPTGPAESRQDIVIVQESSQSPKETTVKRKATASKDGPVKKKGSGKSHLKGTVHTAQIGWGLESKKAGPHKKQKWASSAKQRRILIRKLKKARICATRRFKRQQDPLLNQNPQNDTATSSPESQTPQDEDSEVVFLESVRSYRRNVERFRATEHYEEFRFANLHRITSTDHGIFAIHQAVQALIERLLRDVGPNDFFQLRFQGQGFDSPLFTRRASRDVFDAVDFLENLSRLLQSNAELVAFGSFRVVALIVRGREGGVSRPLKSVLYSQIIGKKQRWLLDFNNATANTCLAASIAGLLMGRDTPDAVILARASEAHTVLEIPPDQLVGFGDIGLFENYFSVTVKVLYHSGSWKYFTTGARVGHKTVYVLHHDNHFYGILNLKGFLGARYVCTHCDHIYSNMERHQCEMHCKMCQRDGCVEDATAMVRCRTCKMFCRSQDCLNIHRKAARCSPKMDCFECGRYVADDHKCRGMKCPRCRMSFDAGTNHQCYMVKGRPQTKTEAYIVFDIECTQETGVHQPNYIYAHHLTSDACWEFEGRTCVGDFLNTFIQTEFKGYTMLAHNSKA
ncbi:uncharacterized protein LOC144768953 [Lissotriton helveticus]